MPDFVHWSAALLALVGLFLWLWSGIRVPEPTERAPFLARRKQLGRIAIFAAVISALLQAVGGTSVRTQLRDIELWASAAPPDVISANLPS